MPPKLKQRRSKPQEQQPPPTAAAAATKGWFRLVEDTRRQSDSGDYDTGEEDRFWEAEARRYYVKFPFIRRYLDPAQLKRLILCSVVCHADPCTFDHHPGTNRDEAMKLMLDDYRLLSAVSSQVKADATAAVGENAGGITAEMLQRLVLSPIPAVVRLGAVREIRSVADWQSSSDDVPFRCSTDADPKKGEKDVFIDGSGKVNTGNTVDGIAHFYVICMRFFVSVEMPITAHSKSSTWGRLENKPLDGTSSFISTKTIHILQCAGRLAPFVMLCDSPNDIFSFNPPRGEIVTFGVALSISMANRQSSAVIRLVMARNHLLRTEPHNYLEAVYDSDNNDDDDHGSKYANSVTTFTLRHAEDMLDKIHAEWNSADDETRRNDANRLKFEVVSANLSNSIYEMRIILDKRRRMKLQGIKIMRGKIESWQCEHTHLTEMSMARAAHLRLARSYLGADGLKAKLDKTDWWQAHLKQKKNNIKQKLD